MLIFHPLPFFPPVHVFYRFPVVQGLYCAEEVQRWKAIVKKLNNKCRNKRTEEEKTQGTQVISESSANLL